MNILRTWVYVNQPAEYGISGCPSCNNEDDQKWSEFKGKCWCPECKIDYAPDHNGVFDGPIPIGTAQLLGLDFRRIDLATRKIIKEDQ